MPRQIYYEGLEILTNGIRLIGSNISISGSNESAFDSCDSEGRETPDGGWRETLRSIRNG